MLTRAVYLSRYTREGRLQTRTSAKLDTPWLHPTRSRSTGSPRAEVPVIVLQISLLKPRRTKVPLRVSLPPSQKGSWDVGLLDGKIMTVFYASKWRVFAPIARLHRSFKLVPAA